MFVPAIEYGLVPRVKHGYGGLGEDDGAVGITDSDKADEGVCEGWEDVDLGGVHRGWWECESALSGGLL